LRIDSTGSNPRRIIRAAGGVFVFGVGPGHWVVMKKGDWRKGIVGAIVRRRALVDNGWLAEHQGAGVGVVDFDAPA
jgi:hypothetical protein